MFVYSIVMYIPIENIGYIYIIQVVLHIYMYILTINNNKKMFIFYIFTYKLYNNIK